MTRREPVYEELDKVVNWLKWQHDDMSWGIHTMEDAIKLWRYACDNQRLSEFADGADSNWTEKDLIEAIGYNPFAAPYEPDVRRRAKEGDMVAHPTRGQVRV